MCPACIANAALIAGSVVTTGGITAYLAKIVRGKSGKIDLFNKLTEGRNNHDNRDEAE